ncbi:MULTISPECIES: YciI family protein [unclassified Streptomyces]|uniref:YciI family protein n=1 Tax=unclassified Streptomyces TaxID=2593676 RepID=UPI0036ED2854
MEYFFYCRDRQGSMPLRMELNEDHWAFMDRYVDVMIARGPTLTADGEGVTGSMHIVDLPDAAAAREFAFDEPNHRAGVYSEVMIRRWRNVLGRTMWEFTGARAGRPRFLVIAHGKPDATGASDRQLAEQHRYLVDGYRHHLIAYGPLLSEDGTGWRGTALLVELPDRGAAEALMAEEPCARDGLYERVEIHDWRFGGRPVDEDDDPHSEGS